MCPADYSFSQLSLAFVDEVAEGLAAFGDVSVDPGVGAAGAFADLLVGEARHAEPEHQALLWLEAVEQRQGSARVEDARWCRRALVRFDVLGRLEARGGADEREGLVLGDRVQPADDVVSCSGWLRTSFIQANATASSAISREMPRRRWSLADQPLMVEPEQRVLAAGWLCPWLTSWRSSLRLTLHVLAPFRRPVRVRAPGGAAADQPGARSAGKAR